MKIIIIGNGGREYAIGQALKNDKKASQIFFAPGNGATSKLGINLPISDFNSLATFAKENEIDLTIVGPEAPLVDGIVDIFEKEGLNIFGPTKEAAKLEGSKAYMKNFLAKYNILTAKYIQTSDANEANSFIDTLKAPIVVKADGLCGGKGVIIAQSKDEAKEAALAMLNGESFSDAGRRVIVEEYLDGYELSMFAICDGDDFVLLPAAQDHKRLLDGDKGPNTGGMGAYAPTPLVNEKIYKNVKEKILKPTLEGMKKEKAPFKGVLFVGLMIVNESVYVLEYNVRFGDPECEVLMPLIKSSVADMFYFGATNQLDKLHLEFYDGYTVGVVIASENYPYKSSTPAKITINGSSEAAHVVYAGVDKKDDALYATGGRVMLSVGNGRSIKEARDNAYELIKNVHFDGMQFREDIAYQALK